ncbi:MULTISPECIES: 2Fe-2S iron-sulfur cluster-binding protein [Streptomyces]|uniref:(2Fe-2S)-binding protein n=2 Tax=Streptomyces TaxID=1883 RepID=A0A420V7M7_9ACTN|nr:MULTISPECIES: 2Fe-2S iron-sulfur cluster-binding protein [Streptomyces]KNE82212.1 ferredoxin [Streptomyces fradiae]OFA56487.1 ferredoxin [Streptomyces fradiae]PQM22798.1 ferredoxin [Streptomyces xinghaiensis]RKM97968.1 (2Fe-2S)-binding protein [Streptomyces xinghaiensis]RNC73894.1 (2Fe-2S)-binding protein [Streptomyces xinghaiensis]
MPKITYRSADGRSRIVEVPEGISVMRGAVTQGVEGIVAECGGAGMCGTCHVYIPREAQTGLPPVHELEDEVLDCTAALRTAASRLSCQLPVTPDTDGLQVELPERQV